MEPYAQTVDLSGMGGALTVGDVLGGSVKTGDYLAVFDGDELVGVYSGDELAGQSLVIDSDRFSVLLSADGSGSGFGFAVQNVIPLPALDMVAVTYHNAEDGSSETRLHAKGGSFIDCYLAGEAYQYDKKALAGWAETEGGEIAYDLGAPIPEDFDKTDLWAVWTDLCFGQEEKYTFNNSSRYFENDEISGYYMNGDDYRTMQLNLFKIYGLGPVPSPILAIVLATLPDWEWQGSCYGMSTTAALQHFGKIDVLSLQDAQSVSELEADEELISFINYYQSQAATSWLTENKAATPGSPMYKTQLMNLFDTVKAGDLVLFTFYRGAAFVTAGHTILLTGAYDNAAGEHVMVAYDCNRPWEYSMGYNYESRFVISPDYSSISYDGEELGAINWTKNFDQFESFSINFDGSPATWYQRLFAHFKEFFDALVKAISVLFSF